MPLERDQVLLAALSLAKGERLTPVQVQKALFLADDKIADAFERGSKYDFQPYDYGPFDRQVYDDAAALARQGLVDIGTDARGWNTYAASAEGLVTARELIARLTEDQQAMLARIVGFVRRLTFSQLVSAIYRGYPRMKARSVFRD